MKKKVVLALFMSMALAFSAAGCGASSSGSSTSASAESAAAETVYGKVTAVDGSSVTVTVGTMETSESGGLSTFTAGSDTKTYDLSDATITKESMGGGAPGGQAPSGSDGGTDSSSDGQTPPEKPSGTESGTDSSTDGQTPPENPSGTESGTDSSSDGQTPPEKPSGTESGTDGSSDGQGAPSAQTESASVDDISEGDILELSLDDSGNVTAVVITSQGGGFGSDAQSVDQGTAANTLSEDSKVSDTSYSSTGDDENALRVDGATVTLDGITVDKTAGSSSNTEAGDFYGMNAGLLATDGAAVTIKNATVNTSAQNGNGVFSYGDGTTVNISDSTITTTGDNSGGIQTTGGGTTNAENLTVTTSGNSSAAIRSDRGGGTVTVNGGTYTTNGYNSPAVYSTADITVDDATLTANNSEALVIEGENSIALTDCNVTGNMSDTEGTSSDTNVHNVMIYQSQSGDAEEGTSSFSMTGGSLTAENGDMFYITNTACTIELSGVTINNQDSDGNLMTIAGNDASHGWGTAGSNGGNVTLTCDGQTLEGNISVDSISTLDMTLKNGSSFTGTINIVDNADGGTAVDNNAVVTIGEGCTWTLTGNCTVTSVSNSGTINYNGYTITLADGTVLSE